MRLADRVRRLEEQRPKGRPRSFVVMLWDKLPDVGPEDMVLHYHVLEPGEVPGGRRIPYERTGIHPDQDSGSRNNQLHRAGSSLQVAAAHSPES